MDSNKDLAERMSILESVQWQHSLGVRQDHEAASAYGQDIPTGLDVDNLESCPIEGPKGHPAFAFEEDLSKSWVYQRSVARGPRVFSIATSKRLTQINQSWSVLSGISLSQISNIAVQSLPIFEDDLKYNHLYDFGAVNYASSIRPLLIVEEEKRPILRRMPATEAINPAPFPDPTSDNQLYQDNQEIAKLRKINRESPNRSKFVEFSSLVQKLDLVFEDESKAEDEGTVVVSDYFQECHWKPQSQNC